MDQRFRREKTLLGRKKKIPSTPTFLKEQKEQDVHSGTPLENISHAYSTLQSGNVMRNTLLLAIVLFVLVFCAGLVMPRVFSIHLDIGEIFGSFREDTTSETSEETSKDLDILILGRGGFENDAPDLTDSIIYAHYDHQTPSMTTLSIPRDLYVQSKILGRVKINEVYSGVKNSLDEETASEHLLETVSLIVGREIKQYVMIDFAGFRKLIDAVGGIDIDVPERLYDHEYPAKNWGYTVVDIPAGIQHFDGDKALKYARSRHTTSDFDRSKRQQLVLSALREKMMSLDVLTSKSKMQNIMSVIQSSVRTNMAMTQVLKMAKNAAKIDPSMIEGHTLDNTCFEALRLCHPGGLLYTPDRELFNGASVLLPKKATPGNISTYDQIQLFVQVFSAYPGLLREFPLTVVNASGKTNLALSVALKLKSIGFPVDERQIRNQKEKSEKTFIRYNSLIIKPDNLLLQAIISVFGFEAREATAEERIGMIGSYELVLGTDTSLYFK